MLILKRARKKAGLTQKGLAQELGIGGQFVFHWEKGVSGIPPRHFKKVSKVLSIPIKTLIKDSVDRYESILLKKAGIR